MPRVPEWRDEPEQVWITCQEMRDLPQLDEFLVLFKVNGEQFTSFVPKSIRRPRQDGYTWSDYSRI